MKTSLVSSFFLLFLSSTIKAQSTPPLFSLVVLSCNSTINGSYVLGCHSGSLLEALCIADNQVLPSSETAVFNFSSTTPITSWNGTSNGTGPGTLSFVQVLGPDNSTLASPMQLQTSLFSNVAPGLISFPYPGTQVAFDKDGLLNIQGAVWVASLWENTVVNVVEYNWWICLNAFQEYAYESLAWVVGSEEPDNDTCQKVDIVRVYP